MSNLRIIGGSLRNRSLQTPKGLKTRPTLAILRKAVFDICQQEVQGAHFLDLFAGSGAMGIEAISRGAKKATLVDKDKNALHCIRANLQLLEIESQVEVIASDAVSTLKKLLGAKIHFDIVYIDPPYATSLKTSLLPGILTFLDTHDLLSAQAIVFIEEGSPAHLDPNALGLQRLTWINSRTFSQSVLHQFRVKQ